MIIFLHFQERIIKNQYEEVTGDGAVDRLGQPAIRGKTGTWVSGSLILGNLFT